MTAQPTMLEPPVLDCEQTARLLWDYLDQQLPEVDVRAVDQHLLECKTRCAPHFAFEHAFLELVHTARPRVIASDTLRARVRALIEADQHESSAGAQSHE